MNTYERTLLRGMRASLTSLGQYTSSDTPTNHRARVEMKCSACANNTFVRFVPVYAVVQVHHSLSVFSMRLSTLLNKAYY